jgi:DNA polymerase-3 subunit beta
LTHRAASKVDEEGVVAVPARLLHEFVAQLPKDLTVDLVFEENRLFVKAGAYSSHVQGSNGEEFPALPLIGGGETIVVDGQTLKACLEKTMLAASSDESRPVLGGVLFHTTEGELFVAATDGYRLAESSLGKVSGDISAIVPAAALQDVLRMIQDNLVNETAIQFSEGQFSFKVGESQLVSRLIDGQYPEYRQLIPATSDITVKISRQELLTAAKLAGLFARESGGSITLKASEIDSELVVKSVASQVGDNNSAIKAEVAGSGEVVLNVRYLTDALNAFESDTLNFRFSGGSITPCVLTADSQPGYQHIVMPLKA